MDEIDEDFRPPLSLKEQKFEVWKDRQKHIMESQTYALKHIAKLFGVANFIVLFIILLSYAIDIYLIGIGKIDPDDRLITKEVMIALIAAIATQLGTIYFSVAKIIFGVPN